MNLLDTDIIIKLLRKGKYEAEAISIITLIEIKTLLEESFNIENLDNKTIETYCNLHQNLKNLGLKIKPPKNYTKTHIFDPK